MDISLAKGLTKEFFRLLPKNLENKLNEINDSLAGRTLNYFFYLVFLSILTFMMLINPLLNPVEMFVEGLFVIIL